MKKLDELPNIGRVMIERLKKINVVTTDDLIDLGSKEAYRRLLKLEGDTCLDTLYALEGAIKEIRWHDLSKNKKDELKDF
jgi:DNA transformation protein